MTKYIGSQPSSVPLTSSDITDGIITTAKIANDAVDNTKLDLSSSYDFSAGLTLGDNLTFDVAGKGVHLGVTSATASNLMDDYEEGTWTPTVTSGGSSFSYSDQHGTYTKIGNVCRAQFFLTVTSGTMSSAVVKIGTFPFTSTATHFTVGTGYNNHTSSGLSSPRTIFFPNGTDLWFYEQGGQGVSTVNGTTMGNNLSQLYTVVYQVA